MPNGTSRGLVALAMLAGALAYLLLSGQSGLAAGSESSSLYSYVADMDYWQRTKREQIVEAVYPLDLSHALGDVPMVLGDWKGEDIPQTNIGVFMVLEPEQYVERVYHNSQGQFVWLMLIGGRSSRTFHPPESCYDSYGWQTQLSSYAVPLDRDQSLYGMVVQATQDSYQHVSYYFYLFPSRTRNPQEGIVIFRVTSPPYGSLEQTMEVQRDFIRQFFTSAEATARALP